MVIIPGDYLEGGGQMLRTSLGLSALTQKPFSMFNIRKGRCTSGIKEQHLQAVKAVAELCGAEAKHAHLESHELEFIPKNVKDGSLTVNIHTAGSVGLVLQALLIASLKSNVEIDIVGGATFGKWACPVDFLKNIFLPLLSKFGYHCEINILREGFYPKGGALVEVKTKKTGKLREVDFIEKGEVEEVSGISVASKGLEKAKVAERQADAAKKILEKHFKDKVEIKAKYSESICNGSGIQLWAKTEKSVLGGSGLGELGKKAEHVGEEAAKSLITEFEGGVVDSYAADQLLPYIALSGQGSLVTSRVTNHIKTNVFVIEKFLPVKFEIKENRIMCSPQ